MTAGALARRLRLGDAVLLGLGSMLGAGVFAVWAPAARAAGTGLLAGLAIAAVVAFANASSSAQLAARYPESGGTYVYGRERLGPWPGFVAGWSFVIGKTASCAAMALTFASYAVPAAWQRPVAVAAVVVLTAVNLLGITRTALVTRVLVVAVLVVLAAVIVAALVAGGRAAGGDPPAVAAAGPAGVLQSAGLLFFAFAGYARLATLGEEVVEPARTIPRAIVIALAIVLGVYVAVAATLLAVLGAGRLARSTAPLADAVAGVPGGPVVVAVGAGLASLGALLALITGVSRTTLAMARGGDLPRPLAAVGAGRSVPWAAELAVGAVVIAAIALTDLRGAIGFSSTGVLVYYLVANLSALSQPAEDRRYPRAVAVIGAIGCVVLVAALPLPSVLGGLGVLAAGVAIRAIVLLIRRRVGKA